MMTLFVSNAINIKSSFTSILNKHFSNCVVLVLLIMVDP